MGSFIPTSEEAMTGLTEAIGSAFTQYTPVGIASEALKTLSAEIEEQKQIREDQAALTRTIDELEQWINNSSLIDDDDKAALIKDMQSSLGALRGRGRIGHRLQGIKADIQKLIESEKIEAAQEFSEKLETIYDHIKEQEIAEKNAEYIESHKNGGAVTRELMKLKLSEIWGRAREHGLGAGENQNPGVISIDDEKAPQRATTGAAISKTARKESEYTAGIPKEKNIVVHKAVTAYFVVGDLANAVWDGNEVAMEKNQNNLINGVGRTTGYVAESGVDLLNDGLKSVKDTVGIDLTMDHQTKKEVAAFVSETSKTVAKTATDVVITGRKTLKQAKKAVSETYEAGVKAVEQTASDVNKTVSKTIDEASNRWSDIWAEDTQKTSEMEKLLVGLRKEYAGLLGANTKTGKRLNTNGDEKVDVDEIRKELDRLGVSLDSFDLNHNGLDKNEMIVALKHIAGFKANPNQMTPKR